MQEIVNNFEASDYNFKLIGVYSEVSDALIGLAQGDKLKDRIERFTKTDSFNLKSVRGVKVTAESEMEHVYGTGALPRAIGVGNVKYSGELKLLKAELLNRIAVANAGFATIFNATFVLLISAKSAVAVTKIVNAGTFLSKGRSNFGAVISGLRFTELGFDISQGDKFVEITLPFLAMDLAYGPIS